MKKILGALMVMLVFTSGKDIQGNKACSQCDFLQALAQAKSPVDTVMVKATFQDLGKIADKTILKELDAEKNLRLADYHYAIGFQPAQCSMFYVPCRDEKVMEKLRVSSVGARLELTCIVYKNHPEGNRPFFVVDKVQLE